MPQVQNNEIPEISKSREGDIVGKKVVEPMIERKTLPVPACQAVKAN